jgi:beta propeller domain-containing protein
MGIGRCARVAIGLVALLGASAAQPRHRTATPAQRQAAEAALARFTSPILVRFSGDAEFQLYVDAVRAAARARGAWWASAGPLQFAQAPAAPNVQSDAVEPLCPADDPACPAYPSDDAERQIVVTGARIAPSNPSITNNQMRGVEEGDIVKQIDHFLLVLQDGRIFVVDTRARGRRLALADRANVYRNAKSDMWYDEMLVFGDRILVTGYSYDEEETELAVFRLGPTGRLAREGVFRLSSNDYYSSSNYATRLIGDTLVTYTPISVSDITDSRFQWPIVRRWRPEEEVDEGTPPPRYGRPLLDAASIYRPARTAYDPMIHTISVCPLASTAAGGDLECRTTALAGLAAVQWYVTRDDVYLWLAAGDDDLPARDDCEAGASHGLADTVPALLYRVPVAGSAPVVIAARGAPPDQFAMQADATRFHALLRMESARCEEGYYDPARLSFFTLPLAGLSSTIAEAPAEAFTTLPPVASHYVASRFTDRHLVYGGLSGFRRGLPDLTNWDANEPYAQRVRAEPGQPAYALPIARPSAVRRLDIRHSVIRAERVGDDIVLTGYRDRGGLIVTMIDLDGPPSIASQARLRGRYESEGRSHAFNSLVERDGSGLMGLPTVPRISDSNREYWRSRASDLSFLEFDRQGQLNPIGELSRSFDYADEKPDGDQDEDGVPGYECEVSCVDWYGNSRPIFTEGRIFALSGTELIEGRVENGAILEVQRLNIALARPPD